MNQQSDSRPPGRAAPVAGQDGAPAPEQQWVRSLLAAQPTGPIPDMVAARVQAAVAREQDRRDLGEFSPDADFEELLELEQRTDLGSFGPNAPSSYTKRSLGMQQDA